MKKIIFLIINNLKYIYLYLKWGLGIGDWGLVRAVMAGISERPVPVREYSTRGGTSG